MSDIGDSDISDSDSSLYSDSEDGSDSDGDQLLELQQLSHQQNSLDKKLLDAARDGKLHKVIRLLEEGANPRAEDGFGLNSLELSARAGHDLVVKKFLEDEEGFNLGEALGLAAHHGYYSTVKIILDHNPDENSMNAALISAAAQDHADIVSELLKRGADPSDPNAEGVTAMQKAEMYGCQNTITILTVRSTPESLEKACSEAAMGENSKLLRGLLIAGASTEYRDADGDQNIHGGALKGNIDVIQVLLDYGANIDSRGQTGMTPLHWAANFGMFIAVRFLLDRGASIDLKDSDGRTPLHSAVIRNHLDIVCELVDRGANKNLEDEHDLTALRYAQLDHRYSIEIILDNEEVSQSDSNVSNVLLTAIDNGNVNVVSNLLKRGAKIEIKNETQETPFQIATRFPQAQKLKYFQKLEDYKRTGVKPNISLKTVMQRASKKSNEMVKQFILQKLANHDPASISNRISDIVSHIKADHFDKKILDKKQMFYLMHASEEDANITLLESIVSQGMIKEREEVLEIMKMIDLEEFGVTDAEQRMKEQVKNAVPSSEGLRNCLQSIRDKYPLSKTKLYWLIFVSFFRHIIMGWGFYALDLFTDLLFIKDMYILARTDFNQTMLECKENFDNEFLNTINQCKDNFDVANCISSLEGIRKQASCFENEQRFQDTNDWIIAGTVSSLHCVLPFVFSFLIGTILIKHFGCALVSIFMFPIPFLTKIYSFICERKLFNVLAWQERNKDKESGVKYEKEKKTILDRISAHDHVVNLSLIIESSVESSFQFFFQTVFLWPSIILTFINTNVSGASEITDLFNRKTFSIALSFATFSMSFYRIRNRAKQNSLTTPSLVFLLLKTSFDCISRIVLFSTWLYVVNEGQFSSAKTAFAYYSTFMVMILFNTICNNSKKYCSSNNWIEIVMNSLSSILSYNNFDFEPIFNNGGKSKIVRKVRHESTLTKQMIYFFMFTILNAGLTASTVAYMSPEMKLIDVNGDPHRLTPDQVTTMIIVGWAAFLLAGVMNIAYYKVHPSSVDFSPSRLWKKMFIYLLGKKMSLWQDFDQNIVGDDTMEMQNQTAANQDVERV